MSANLNINEEAAPPQDVFGLNPHATDVNLEISDSVKHRMKATEELPTKDELQLSITNGPFVEKYLEKFRSKDAFCLLLRKIPDDDGDLKDIIKNYRTTTKGNVLVFNKFYLGNGLLESIPADQLLLDLNQAINAYDTQRFCKRACSQMIA